MKKIVAILLCVVLVTALTGCSLFGSSKKDNTNLSDIKITDKVTHKAPEGAENRYAYTSGKDQELIDWYKDDYGIGFVEEICIIYGDKDDKPLAMYDYFVCESEDDAKALMALYSEGLEDNPYTVEGTVMITVSAKEELEMLIDANKMFATVQFGDTCKDFAEFWKDTSMFIDYTVKD